MYYRIIRNDILKSKLVTLTTMIFVAAAAMLVSLAAILVINLSGAIDTLMEEAKTPHFLQMHSGEIDMERLESFAKNNSQVDEFQVLEFLNVEGAEIMFNETSLANNVQDNGFSRQSEKFDFLLDLDGNVIKVSDGELYVPISYMIDGTTEIGDMAVIGGKEFTVTGFLRDSQMNSTLSSSKRFLVSKNDYEEIKGFGNMEYLIEFRLKDLSELGKFEANYVSAGLEANGPTITYPLFKTINAISDGLMIAVLLLISILVVAIAFMCIRFTLLAKIEDDYREIGVLKALGLRISDIKKIYLAKYAAIAAVGSIFGLLLSFIFKGMLLENIRLYMGESENASYGLVFGIIGVLVVFLAIIGYVNGVLRRFRKISVAEAILFGNSDGKISSGTHFCLSRNILFGTNVFLGIKDVLARKKIYSTMLIVLVISSFITIVPQNLYNTISAKSFITYMGIGSSDMRIDIQQTNNISEKTADIIKKMDNDSDISNFVALTTRKFQVKMGDNSIESIKIELGDHSIFPVKYSKGREPLGEDEIALSTINANEFGKEVGDVLTLVIAGREKNFIISGIYSDVTNGGKTAKAVFSENSADIMWSVISAELSDKSNVSSKVSEYGSRYNFAKVSSIDHYIKQTYGSTISSIRKAAIAAIAVSLIITVLVTLLFMKMLVTKDRYSIVVMKALGFTNLDIVLQYISRSCLVLFVGILLGTILANTLGEVLAGAVISSFGASTFKFVINPVSAYLLSPLMMVCSVLIATIIGTSRAGQIKISENIKE
ncbi:ABC transporter permease [Anaerobacillus isosaccharinicus]|uniref:ABC transporter permease n=1 Tax=Anaerobacillus isosaccharinicus TaxID=1532552 RepID=A0A1S2MHK3_9BACI|nr:FtsX-like permease family protein [Anaerobacillus isosaccharinicus]MBA5586507.1 FtsX-like permease family protein [Anaerobacillus isosaccharinicus]QOY35252.1 FtsX-like permease family protein [Anaerobacillus isosaccharinicus]